MTMQSPMSAGQPGQNSGLGSRVARYLGAHWVAVVLTVLVIVFVADNRDRVSIDLFFVHLHSPLWLILAAATVIRILIGLLIARRRAVRRSPPN